LFPRNEQDLEVEDIPMSDPDTTPAVPWLQSLLKAKAYLYLSLLEVPVIIWTINIKSNTKIPALKSTLLSHKVV
jgi:hypothetical protein